MVLLHYSVHSQNENVLMGFTTTYLDYKINKKKMK